MLKPPAPWGLIAFVVAGLILLTGLLYLGPPENGTNGPALQMLGHALSILAGILLAIITMMGDPRNLYRGSWQIASMHRHQIRRVLDRSLLFFWLYLLTITFAFVAVVLGEYTSDVFDSYLVRWMKHVALSLSSVALLWSFGLPVIIRRAQLHRLDVEVDRRKDEAREELDRFAKDVEDWKREEEPPPQD